MKNCFSGRRWIKIASAATPEEREKVIHHQMSPHWFLITRRKMLGSLLAGIGWLLSGAGIPALAQKKAKRRSYAVLLPPPPKWDKSVDGLENGFCWAADFQRSLMTANTV